MIICTLIKTCTKIVLPVTGQLHRQMTGYLCNNVSSTPSCPCCLFFKQGNSRTRYTPLYVPRASSWFSHCSSQACQQMQFKSGASSNSGCFPSLRLQSFAGPRRSRETLIDFSSCGQNASVRIFVSKRRQLFNLKCNVGPFSWAKGFSTAGIMAGLLLCYSTSDPVHAEVADNNGIRDNSADSSSDHFSHGKKVYTDYSVIGIPGDGRCLFRSVAHGACLRSGKPAPNEGHQKQLADELRTMVADEFIRRREETEWFIEGDFDKYVSQVRKPHVWGGEPELLMLSHVLRMPITVYMRDDNYDGLISIAEYGQEYGKDNPIRVLYHGYGHYDALQISGKKGAKSTL